MHRREVVSDARARQISREASQISTAIAGVVGLSATALDPGAVWIAALVGALAVGVAVVNARLARERR